VDVTPLHTLFDGGMVIVNAKTYYQSSH
jgi:hypothetical protein